MSEGYSISIILPVYNEEENIEKVVEEANKFFTQNTFNDYEMIVINDGSTDNTYGILEKIFQGRPYIKLVTHHKNLGYGRALLSGIKNSTSSLLFFMDADGQFKIDSLKAMLSYIPEYDIIIGYRDKRKDSFYRVLLGKIYNFLGCLLFRLNFKDINCGVKLFKRETIKDAFMTKGGLFYTEVLLKAQNKGFKIKEIPVEHFLRIKGKQTGGKPKVIFVAIVDLVKLGFNLLFNRNRYRLAKER